MCDRFQGEATSAGPEPAYRDHDEQYRNRDEGKDPAHLTEIEQKGDNEARLRRLCPSLTAAIRLAIFRRFEPVAGGARLTT